MTKTVKVVIEGKYLKMIKAIYDKPSAHIMMKKFSSKIRKKTKMPTLTTVIQYSPESPSQSSQATTKNKGIQIQNKEVKLTVCR